MMRVSTLLFLFAVACARPLAAASWADLRYRADDPAARLDIHTPGADGPHAVLVWLHGGDWRAGDKRLADEQIARVTATGHVLVSVEYPLTPARHPAQIEHAAAALAFVSRNIARYGGDPARIRLIGADAGAHLAALLAVDPHWLSLHGLTPAILQGVVLVRPNSLDLEASFAAARDRGERAEWAGQWGERPQDWLKASPLLQIAAGNLMPAMLLLAARDGNANLARQRERFSDRLREAGVANQTLLLAAPTRAMEGRFGAVDESGSEAIFAWLDALALPRVPRFEQLDFQADFVSGMRDGNTPLRGAEVAFLLPFRGRLFASLSDADAQSDVPARILTKTSKNADWLQAQAFAAGAQFSLLTGVRLQRDGAAQALPRAVELMLAGVVRREGVPQWQWSAVDGHFADIAKSPRHALTAALVHRDKVTGADVLLLGSRGGGVNAASWNAALADLQWHAAAELEGADIAAFSIANGHAVAAVNGKNSGLYQRVDGTAARWLRVADFDIAGVADVVVTAMSTVDDPAGAGHDVLLLAHARSGRIVRVDPMSGFGKTLELDVAAGFAEVWGGALPWVDFGGNAFVSLQHPETAEAVTAIGLKLRHPQSHTAPHNGAWYLLRQQDGSYSYGLSYDFSDPLSNGSSLRSVRALAVSPFVEEGGAAFYFGGFDAHAADRDSAWIYRGEMTGVSPQRGLWWDRGHSGHGIDLQPVAGRWMLTLTTYDEKGAPVWYAALGQIVGSRFVVERGGLTRYRYALDRDPPQRRNAVGSGDVSIRFGLGLQDGACSAGDVDRADAAALAELSLNIDGRKTRWCIEPMRFAQPGLPKTDGNGLWYAGPGDSGWGVSIVERGVDGRSLGVAYVYYYDANGEPRWALGSAPVVDGNARYALRAFKGYCPGCARTDVTSAPVGEFVHRLSGYCAAVGGTGSLNIGISGEDQSRFVRERFPMNRLSTAACY